MNAQCEQLLALIRNRDKFSEHMYERCVNAVNEKFETQKQFGEDNE